MNSPDLTNVVWKKSSRSSGNGQCVEVARIPSMVAVRDSKNPGGGALVVTLDSWATFMGNIKNGRMK